MKHENKVILVGDIVHIFKRPKFAMVTIKTVYGSRVPNYPQVKVYGELAEKVVEGMVGTRVKVEGYYVSEKEKGKITNSIVANVLEETEEKSKNEVYISGYVTRIEENTKDTIRIIIKSLHGKYKNTISTFLYTKNPREVLEEIKKGDKVAVYGNIQTKKRVYPDVVKFYSDITLRDVRRIEEE